MSDELIIAGDATVLVPSGRLVLTRAPELLNLSLLQQQVEKFQVITVENHASATAALKNLRVIRQKVEKFHETQKAPINGIRSLALDLERTDVSSVKSLETTLGARVLAFETEVERQRKIEEERLRREALEQAQKEADAKAKALRDAAKVEEDRKTKRQLNLQARSVEAAPVFVPAVKVSAPVTTSSTTTRWSVEITDIRELVKAVADGRVPLAALEPERLLDSHPWLTAQAVQLREEFSIPGTVAVKKTTLSGR